MAKNQKANAPAGLSEEQQKALQEEMRNNQAIATRAKIAGNLLPSIITTYPGLSPEEMVDKAEKIASAAMDKLLGITFKEKE